MSELCRKGLHAGSIQYRDMWLNYGHERFRDKDTPVARRRERLVLSMPAGPVMTAEILGLSPQVAAEYATRSEKALARDLNALVAPGLVRREGRAYLANRAIIRAFLPPKIVSLA